MIDSIGKKIKVVEAVSECIGLENVTVSHQRVQEEKRTYDFIVSRAVTNLPDLVKICRGKLKKVQQNAIPNGIICLKGGNLEEELKPFKKDVDVVELSEYFSEEFYETKKLVYLPIG